MCYDNRLWREGLQLTLPPASMVNCFFGWFGLDGVAIMGRTSEVLIAVFQ
jgi:hypothetical protein